jgi:membrane-associated phospholipid phosphatase
VPVRDRIGQLRSWFATDARRVSHRLGLTWRGWCVLGAGVIALGVAVTVLGGVSEDVTQHNGLARSDPSHLRLFTEHRSDWLVQAARIASDFGNVAILALVAIGAGLLLWRRGLPVAIAAAPAFALGAAAAVADATKRLVDRGRPPAALRLVVEGDPSFPSGQATDSAAVYVTLGLVLAVFVFRRPLLRVVAVVGSATLAAVVGTSRLVLGVHWPSDVLAGWALGAAVALGVTIAATVLVGLMPTDRTPPRGWLRLATVLIGRVLTLERHPTRRRAGLHAA